MKRKLSAWLVALIGLSFAVPAPAYAAVQVKVVNRGAASGIGTCASVPVYDSTPATSDCASGYASLALGATSTAATIQATFAGSGWRVRYERVSDGYDYAWHDGPLWLSISQATAQTYNVYTERISTDSTPGWLSGASSDPTKFGSWRGSPVEIAGFWANDPAVYPVGPPISGCGGCGSLQGFAGPVDAGIAPPEFTQGWAGEAAGVHDTFWRDTFRNLKQFRAGKGTVYMRPWYEYNGDWMDYSVRNATDAANFKTAFNRMAGIARTEFPAMRIMLGTAASGPFDVASALPASASYDVVSIDFYNEWPWCTTTVCFNNKIAVADGGSPNSFATLKAMATNAGKPVIVSEWANRGEVRTAANGGGGESPQFMRDWNAYLRANAGTGAGKILAEVNFDLWPDSFVLTNIDESGAATTADLQPQTAAEYRRLW